jgi:hypothetical protein
MPRAQQLRDHIEKHFRTLPWCRRYLERTGEQRYLVALRSLVDAGVVEEYVPGERSSRVLPCGLGVECTVVTRAGVGSQVPATRRRPRLIRGAV